MAKRDAEEDLAIAGRVAELVAVAERLLAGDVSRREAMAWAVAHDRPPAPSPFGRNRAAHDLHLCLYALDSAVIRDGDVRHFLDEVRDGAVPFACDLAAARVAIAKLPALAGRPSFRFDGDGLGWFEAVRFASPATGRAFLAASQLEPPFPASTLFTTTALATADRADVVADLLDTLALDLDDVEPAVPVELPRWHLWRLDDNGQRAIVATFSGLAKGRAALAAYEARGHKQTYWLERVADDA